MIRKLLAVLGLTIVALIAAPSAALAYVPDGDGVGSVTGRPAPGAVVSVGFDGTFAPGERVELVVSCPGAAQMVLDDVADAGGSTDTEFTVPAGATGTCTIAARGVSSGEAGAAAFTVVSGNAGAPGDGSGSGLAVTGVSPAVAVWLGIGALVVGAALLRVRAMRRTAGR